MIRSTLVVVFSALCFATPPAPDTLESLRQRADHGDAHAQVELGSAYEHGNGMKQSLIEAFRWYRKAAEQGDAHGQFNLGRMYQRGSGVTRNPAEALRWFGKAAAQGDSETLFHFGFMYEWGDGVAHDLAEAIRWYRKAADSGNARAQSRIGDLYREGQGVARDYTEALRWYRKAAEQGDRTAWFNLGEMYFAGQGVAQDHAEAARWFQCPKLSEEMLATCKEVTGADLPEGATRLLEKMNCEADGSFASAIDLNGDGSPAYQVCCSQESHGPCGAVLIGQVGTEWKDLSAKGWPLSGSSACGSLLVLESKRGGFHDICPVEACSPGTGYGETPCLPMIWQYDGSRYRAVARTPPKASSK